MIEDCLTQLRQLVFNNTKLNPADKRAVLDIDSQLKRKGCLSPAQQRLVSKLYKKFQSVSVQRLRRDAEAKQLGITAKMNMENWRDI